MLPPTPYRWTRRRWYEARRLARLAERGALRSDVPMVAHYLWLIDATPGMHGDDPLTYRLVDRAAWRRGVPF